MVYAMKLEHVKDVYFLFGPKHNTIEEISDLPAYECFEDRVISLPTPNGPKIIQGYLVHRYEHACMISDPTKETNRVYPCFIYKGCRMKPYPKNNLEFVEDANV